MGTTTHGMTKTPTYKSWLSMKARCYNENTGRFEDYGGRGISVCARWRESFESFLEDIGARPEGKTLDRYPDCNGNYEPGNCRWATAEEQNNNRNSSRILTFLGESLSVAQWSRRLGLDRHKVSSRLSAGWSLKRALTTPKIPRGEGRERNTLGQYGGIMHKVAGFLIIEMALVVAAMALIAYVCLPELRTP